MRVIRFVVNHADHKAGDIAAVDDQLATDAISCGAAVPCVDAVPERKAPETVAAKAAPEVK